MATTFWRMAAVFGILIFLSIFIPRYMELLRFQKCLESNAKVNGTHYAIKTFHEIHGRWPQSLNDLPGGFPVVTAACRYDDWTWHPRVEVSEEVLGKIDEAQAKEDLDKWLYDPNTGELVFACTAKNIK